MSGMERQVGEDRFLVVGLGSIGRRHAANLHRLRPGSSIAALRSTKSPSAPPPEVSWQFTNWRDALAFQPSAAIVCNPASGHLEAARILLEAGIPMLIEKPVADKLTGLRSFAQDVRRVGVPVAVGYNLRFSPAFAQARCLIGEGAIGDVLAARAEVGQYLPDWRPRSRYQDGVSARRALGGGPLLELSHEIDYLLWMFGCPAEVSAVGGRLGTLEIDVEDTVELSLIYEAPRRLFNVHLDFLQRVADRRCRFIGSDGTLTVEATSGTVSLYRAGERCWEPASIFAGDPNQPYLDELSAFLRLPAGGGPLATLEEACDVLTVVEAATLSMAQRTIVGVHDVV